jgi:hypothetical protein
MRALRSASASTSHGPIAASKPSALPRSRM